MKKIFLLYLSLFLLMFNTTNTLSETRTLMNLNGKWEFEQTKTAFIPEKFTRTIQVPGLIDLAEPPVEQHKNYFSGTHEPRYNWYRFKFKVSPDKKGKYAVLNLLK